MEMRIGGGRYILEKKIGRGAFGFIFLVTDTEKEEQFAVKFEPARTRHPQLFYEYNIYKVLNGGVGIPMVWSFFSEKEFNFMIMDLLGPTLEDLFDYCGRKFSLKTVLMLADQMIRRVEYLHSKCLLHRDMKPENFLMGTGKHGNQVYLIDFGLAKRYMSPISKKHISYNIGISMVGTARYASCNTHMGKEQSRRDDMEALGYIFLYFLRGSLPWQGIKEKTPEKYERVGIIKRTISLEELCTGLPIEFSNYIRYCRELKFEGQPDYQRLRKMFRDLFLRKSHIYDGMFDWTLPKMKINRSITNCSMNFECDNGTEPIAVSDPIIMIGSDHNAACNSNTLEPCHKSSPSNSLNAIRPLIATPIGSSSNLVYSNSHSYARDDLIQENTLHSLQTENDENSKVSFRSEKNVLSEHRKSQQENTNIASGIRKKRKISVKKLLPKDEDPH